jgi:hypothetical protein
MGRRKINRLFVHSMLLGFSLLPAIGNAFDLTFEPRLEAGIMDYAFELEPVSYPNGGGGTTTENGFKLVSPMSFVTSGVTLFSNKFFVDFYVQKGFSTSDRATNTLSGDEVEALLGDRLTTIVYSEFDREEYSMSIGYALGKQLVLFGGYRKAKTNFTEIISVDQDIVRQGTTIELTGSGERDINFKQDGFFLGGAYALLFGESSALIFNSAIAILEGKYFSEVDLDLLASDSDKPFKLPIGYDSIGDTVGLNFGVSWKGNIVDNVGYTLGVSGYSYDFDAKEQDVADLSESVLRFSAGLSYQF